MRNHGIPYPDILIWGAIALELGGGLMLVAGLYARWVALALFFYTLSLALIFHPYWTASDPAAARTISFDIEARIEVCADPFRNNSW
jgi:uncharacterized membrane protein YphA (DoxX/SURF4 family)